MRLLPPRLAVELLPVLRGWQGSALGVEVVARALVRGGMRAARVRQGQGLGEGTGKEGGFGPPRMEAGSRTGVER